MGWDDPADGLLGRFSPARPATEHSRNLSGSISGLFLALSESLEFGLSISHDNY
jgi:hypothetical protein